MSSIPRHDGLNGRWLAPDPIAGDASDPGSLNRYTYVLNDPVNFVDPLGLSMWPWDPWDGGGFGRDGGSTRSAA